MTGRLALPGQVLRHRSADSCVCRENVRMLAGARALRGRPAGLRSITHSRVASMCVLRSLPPPAALTPRALVRGGAPFLAQHPLVRRPGSLRVWRDARSLPMRLPEDRRPRTMATTNLPVKHTDSSLGASPVGCSRAQNQVGVGASAVFAPAHHSFRRRVHRVRRDGAGRAGQLGTQRQHVAYDFRARMMRGGDDAGR
jgi:hypothetical protein